MLSVIPTEVRDRQIILAPLRLILACLGSNAEPPLANRDRMAAYREWHNGDLVDRLLTWILVAPHLERAPGQPHHLRAAFAIAEYVRSGLLDLKVGRWGNYGDAGIRSRVGLRWCSLGDRCWQGRREGRRFWQPR